MNRKTITRRSAPPVLLLRNVRDGNDRSMVFCEGDKLVGELLRSDWRPRALFCTPKMISAAERFLSAGSPAPLTVLSDSVMAFCSDLAAPPGLIALAKPPERWAAAPLHNTPLGLVIHGVQLPQNVGALLRTAEAAGVTEAFATPASADPWGPKALRGSAGSAFRVRVNRFPSLAKILEHLRARAIASVAASQNGRVNYDQIDWKRPMALVLGSEGAGFAGSELAAMDHIVRIPMRGKVESLNVAAAAAVCLFEAVRQRNHGN